MKNSLHLLILVALFLALPAKADAVLLVDTGQPIYDDIFTIIHLTQHVASEFVLNQEYVLTDIFGYLNKNIHQGDGTLTLRIYGDGGDIPDKNQLLFSQAFIVPPHIPAWEFPEPRQSDWYGVSDMNLALGAGAYWLAFEVRLPPFLQRYAGGMAQGAPYPLLNDAISNDINAIHYSPTSVQLGHGIRIYGNSTAPTPIPEPSSLALFGLGAFGLLPRKRNLSSTE